MRRIVQFLLCVMLVFGSLAVAPGQQAGQPTIQASIEIQTGGPLGCRVVTVEPDPIRAAKRNMAIVWQVTNNCRDGRTVSVGNFKHRQDNDRRKDPLEFEANPTIAAGQTGTIRGRVKVLPQSDLGTYKYDVILNGQVALDPELEIEE